MSKNLKNELVREIQNGSTSAFEALYIQCWQSEFNKAFKKLRSRQDAEDAVQDAFTELWENRETMNAYSSAGLLDSLVNKHCVRYSNAIAA